MGDVVRYLRGFILEQNFALEQLILTSANAEDHHETSHEVFRMTATLFRKSKEREVQEESSREKTANHRRFSREGCCIAVIDILRQ